MNYKRKIVLSSIELPILSDQEVRTKFSKGWSYSNIYYFKPVRDLYLILRDSNSPHLSLRDIHRLFEQQTGSYDWSERKILEYLNALKNFGLINGNNEVAKDLFCNSLLNSNLSDEDYKDLEWLFFNYIRFNEICTWYLGPSKMFDQEPQAILPTQLIEDSLPIFALKSRGFFNEFTFDLGSEKLFIISDKNTHLMRFMDVFFKWATGLNLMEKFSLKPVGRNINGKEVTVSYFHRPFKAFDLHTFIKKNNFKSRYIPVPELIFAIAQQKRYPVVDIKNHIINTIETNSSFTYERTSEVFLIKGKREARPIKDATHLFIEIKGSYMSHLILRK